jgi:hypothetical protein
MSLQRYYELFITQVEVLQEVEVTIPDIAAVNAMTAWNGRVGAPVDADRERAIKQTLQNPLSTYLTHFRSSFLDGTDIYPSTLHDAYHIHQ